MAKNNRGSVFQRTAGRHKGKWVARVELPKGQDGKRRRAEFLFDTEREALDKRDDVRSDLKKGREPIAKTETPDLASYLQDWLAGRKPDVSPNTYTRYGCAVNLHLKNDAIGRLRLSEITTNTVNELINRRRKAGVGAATLANIRAVLSTALGQAKDEGRIHENPVRGSKPPKQPDKELRFLDAKQTKSLIGKAAGDPIEPLLVAAIYTGMRLSELLGLTWDRVDFAKKTIRIDRQLQRSERAFRFGPLKTRKGARTIPMAAPLETKLKAIKRSVGQPKDAETSVPNLIFLSPAHQPWHRKTVLERTNALMKQAKVPEIGFHALRHTCASLLINGGANVLLVQRQLGHATAQMTLEIYSHLFEERIHENVDMLTKALK